MLENLYFISPFRLLQACSTFPTTFNLSKMLSMLSLASNPLNFSTLKPSTLQPLAFQTRSNQKRWNHFLLLSFLQIPYPINQETQLALILTTSRIWPPLLLSLWFKLWSSFIQIILTSLSASTPAPTEQSNWSFWKVNPVTSLLRQNPA